MSTINSKSCNLLSLSLSGGFLFFTTISCRSENTNSESQSVEIAQTDLKSQGAVGFCWAYTTMAMIEADFKKRTGKNLNLSEEHLGYFAIRERFSSRMKFHLDYVQGKIPGKFPSTILDQMKRSALTEGNSLMESFDSKKSSQLEKYAPPIAAFTLINDYGIVPEEVWSHKVSVGDKTPGQEAGFKSSLNSIYDSMVQDFEPRNLVPIEEIKSKLESFMVPSLFPKKPIQSSFSFQGAQYNPQSFAKEYLKFDLKEYELASPSSIDELKKNLERAKRTLAKGYTVPFGLPIQKSRIGIYSGVFANATVDAPTTKEYTPHPLEPTGYHAVLMTDFVNIGGKEGKVENLNEELRKPINDLDYFVVKNSWAAVSLESISTLDESLAAKPVQKVESSSKDSSEIVAASSQISGVSAKKNSQFELSNLAEVVLSEKEGRLFLNNSKFIVKRDYIFDGLTQGKGEIFFVFRKAIQ